MQQLSTSQHLLPNMAPQVRLLSTALLLGAECHSAVVHGTQIKSIFCRAHRDSLAVKHCQGS